jgi:ABC-type glycerol-3-phosphate transport system substrate-binding protein
MKSRLLAALVAGIALAAFSTASSAQTARDSVEVKKPGAVDSAKARKAAASKQTEAPKAVEQQGTKPASLRKAPADYGSGSDCHHSAKESDA